MSSIGSEPQFQSPDDRESNITYDYGQVPIPQDTQIEQPQPGYQPQPEQPIEPQGEPEIIENRVSYLDPRFPSKLFEKVGKNVILVNRMDYYGNMIPLGSFCFAITFIIYGFYRAKVFKVNDTFLWTVILLFGGIGQATAGFLEFIKGRTFPAALYTIYGGYCLSHFLYYIIPKIPGEEMVYPMNSPSMCAYYSAWVVISFAIALASVKINMLFVLQCLCTLVFFLLRAVGEGCGSLHTKRNAAGILQAIAGFFSLLVFFSQIINNQTMGYQAFPVGQLGHPNHIDIEARPQPAAPTEP